MLSENYSMIYFWRTCPIFLFAENRPHRFLNSRLPPSRLQYKADWDFIVS